MGVDIEVHNSVEVHLVEVRLVEVRLVEKILAGVHISRSIKN
jgi:hypothetical protein